MLIYWKITKWIRFNKNKFPFKLTFLWLFLILFSVLRQKRLLQTSATPSPQLPRLMGKTWTIPICNCCYGRLKQWRPCCQLWWEPYVCSRAERHNFLQKDTIVCCKYFFILSFCTYFVYKEIMFWITIHEF